MCGKRGVKDAFMFKKLLIFFVVLCGVQASAANRELPDLEQPKVHAPQMARGMVLEWEQKHDGPQPVELQNVTDHLNNSLKVKVVRVTAFERPTARQVKRVNVVVNEV